MNKEQEIYRERFNLDWENIPTLKDLSDDLKLATPDHDEDWLDLRNVEGKYKIKKRKGKSSITPKLVKLHNAWRYAALSEPFLIDAKLFNAAPVTGDDAGKSKPAEILLNYQLTKKMDLVNLMDEIARACEEEGTAVLRPYWVRKTKKSTKIVQEPFVDENGNQGYIEKEVEYEEVLDENPWVDVLDYDSLYVDPSCKGDISKANFIIYREPARLADLKDSEGYYLDDLRKQLIAENDNESPESLNWQKEFLGEESEFLSSPSTNAEGQVFDNPQKGTRGHFFRFEHWLDWDIHNDGNLVPIVVTIAKGHIIRMELNPYLQKPFIFIPLNKVRGSVWGEADAELLRDHQQIKGALTRSIIDAIGSIASGQLGIMKESLDPVNLKRFLAGEKYEFNRGIGPDFFKEHQLPNIPPTAIELIRLQDASAEAYTGIKTFGEGIHESSVGSSVGGIKSVLDTSSKREMAIIRRVARGLLEVGYIILDLNRKYLSSEQVINITKNIKQFKKDLINYQQYQEQLNKGVQPPEVKEEPTDPFEGLEVLSTPQGEHFISINREHLSARVDISLTVSTPEADDEKAQNLAFIIQTLGDSAPMEFKFKLIAEFARLKKLPDLADFLLNYKPQPSPEEQEAAKLEQEVKKSLIAAEYAKAQENNAQAERHKAVAYASSAQAQLYLAQALKEKSETDLKDLEYVEQENGVHHERQKELEMLKHSAHMESAQIGANVKASEAIKGAKTAFDMELSKKEQEKKTAIALEKLKAEVEIAKAKQANSSTNNGE